MTLTPAVTVTPVHLDSSPRENCGETTGFYDQFGQPKVAGRSVYVARQDICGRYMTRFDWLSPDAGVMHYSIK